MPILLKFAWLLAIYVNVLCLAIPAWGIIKEKMPPLSRKASALLMIGLIILIILAGSGIAWLSLSLFYHLLPLTPLLTRGALVLTFKSIMGKPVAEAAKHRAEYRTIATGLMAITFAGLVALTIANAQFAMILLLPVYYMLISFLGLLVVLNVQSYKEFFWVEMLGDAFLDLATLSMLLSIVSIFLLSGKPDQTAFYNYLFTSLALGVWLIDHLVRLYIEWHIFDGKVNPKPPKTVKPTNNS